MTHQRLLLSGISMAALAYAFPEIAAAQELANASISGDLASEPLVDADIVVTAQRRTQRLKDVPISASVVSGDFLVERGLQSVSDLAVRLPNVRITQAPASDLLNIRGVGSGLNAGFEQSVGTFVDGIYRGRSRTSRAALFDIERVELLKGPQTTFFGNNAIAGAINITTRKPTSDFELNTTALIDPKDERYILEAGVSGPLTPTLRARAAIQFSGQDGYIKNTRIDQDGPRLRDVVGRVSFDWSPTSRLDVTGRLDRGRFRDTGVYNVELLNCPAASAFGVPRGPCGRSLAASGSNLDDDLNYESAAGPSFFNYDFTEAMLSATFHTDNHSITATTGYFDHKFDYLIDVTAAAQSSAIGTEAGFPTFFHENFRQISQEIRFQTTNPAFIEYMAGAYVSQGDLTLDSVSGFYFAPFGAAIQPANPAARVAVNIDNSQKENSFSFFGAVTVNVSENFRINLGSRYSIVDKHGDRVVTLGTAGDSPRVSNFVAGTPAVQSALAALLSVPTANYSQRYRSDKKFMPSASVQLDVLEDTMLYASYAKGFKAGGYGFYLSGSTFDPETVDSYELGIKGNFFDRLVSVNFAIFQSKFDNLQESININPPGGGTINVVQNAAKSTAKGIEFDINVRPSSRLTLSADLAYLSSKYDEYMGAPCASLENLQPQCTQDLSGVRRAFAPKFSGNVGFSYTVPFESTDLELKLSPLLYFSSKYFQQATADPLLTQSGYSKVDLRISLGRRDDRWSLAVIGSNLTNTKTGSFRSVLAGSPGSAIVLPDPPRRIAFSLSTKF